MLQLQLQTTSRSRQQNLALYTERHLHSVAIMLEMTSRRVECTHFNLDFSQMPAVMQQLHRCGEVFASENFSSIFAGQL